MSRFTIHDLASIVDARAESGGEASYTRKLLDRGSEHCAKKLGEEAVETVIDAIGKDRDHLIAESAVLLFHLLVLLKSRGVKLEEVEAALEQRTGMSGLEETAAHKRDGPACAPRPTQTGERRRHGCSCTGASVQSVPDIFPGAVGASARR